MLLCLDVGNTHILGGIFDQKKLLLRFRYATHLIGTADQLGMFLITFLQTHQVDRKAIRAVSICSVVPSCDYTIQHAINRYFEATYFVLKAGVKTGLNVVTKYAAEVGTDRIANAIGAFCAFPNKHLIVIDLGTATTVCAIHQNRDYLGGVILPGLRLGMESLKTSTAKLTEVNIEKPTQYLGRTTKESIQSGLYYGTLGALKEIIQGLSKEVFHGLPIIVGTGGFAQLYKTQQLFDHIFPDLVLTGLFEAYQMNRG